MTSLRPRRQQRGGSKAETDGPLPLPRPFPQLGSLVSIEKQKFPYAIIARIRRRSDGRRYRPDDTVSLLTPNGQWVDGVRFAALTAFPMPISREDDSMSSPSEDGERTPRPPPTAVQRAAATFAEPFAADGHQSVCATCGTGGMLVLCTSCVHCSHLACMVPARETVPGNEWSCHECEQQDTPLGNARATFAAVERAIKAFQAADTYGAFAAPVSRLFVNGKYTDAVPHPMDLSTMSAKATTGHYRSLSALADDLELMVRNCVTFNTKIDPTIVDYAGDFGVVALKALKTESKRLRDEGVLSVSDVVMALAVAKVHPPVPPVPLLWPSSEGMTYEVRVRVSAACPWSKAVLRYTTDGSEPTIDSKLWPMDGVVLRGTTTLRVASFAAPQYVSGEVNGPGASFLRSTVVTATYLVHDSEASLSTSSAALSQPPTQTERQEANTTVANPAAQTPQARSEKNPSATTAASTRRKTASGGSVGKQARRVPPSRAIREAILSDVPLWVAFLRHVEVVASMESGTLHQEEMDMYRRVAEAVIAAKEIEEGAVDPADVERVVRDVELFRAVNLDHWLPLDPRAYTPAQPSAERSRD